MSLPPPVDAARVVVLVSGRVQGVGFRWWVRTTAVPLGLRGSAVNRVDGRVEVVAEGDREACEQLVQAVIAGEGPGRVTDVAVRWEPPAGVAGFTVS
jgi:acylphosphatase